MGNAYRRDHMPTQDFLHEGMCVREGVLVFEIGKAVESNYGVELYLRSFLYFRVRCHGDDESMNGGVCLTAGSETAMKV